MDRATTASSLLNILLEFEDTSGFSQKDKKQFSDLKRAIVHLLLKNMRPFSLRSSGSCNAECPITSRRKLKVRAYKRRGRSRESSHSSDSDTDSLESIFLGARKTYSLPSTIYYFPESPPLSGNNSPERTPIASENCDPSVSDSSDSNYAKMYGLRDSSVLLHRLDCINLPPEIILNKSDISVISRTSKKRKNNRVQTPSSQLPPPSTPSPSTPASSTIKRRDINPESESWSIANQTSEPNVPDLMKHSATTSINLLNSRIPPVSQIKDSVQDSEGQQSRSPKKSLNCCRGSLDDEPFIGFVTPDILSKEYSTSSHPKDMRSSTSQIAEYCPLTRITTLSLSQDEISPLMSNAPSSKNLHSTRSRIHLPSRERLSAPLSSYRPPKNQSSTRRRSLNVKSVPRKTGKCSTNVYSTSRPPKENLLKSSSSQLSKPCLLPESPLPRLVVHRLSQDEILTLSLNPSSSEHHLSSFSIHPPSGERLSTPASSHRPSGDQTSISLRPRNAKAALHSPPKTNYKSSSNVCSTSRIPEDSLLRSSVSQLAENCNLPQSSICRLSEDGFSTKLSIHQPSEDRISSISLRGRSVKCGCSHPKRKHKSSSDENITSRLSNDTVLLSSTDRSSRNGHLTRLSSCQVPKDRFSNQSSGHLSSRDIPSTSSSIHQPSENRHWHCFRARSVKGGRSRPKRKHKSSSDENIISRLTNDTGLISSTDRSSRNGHLTRLSSCEVPKDRSSWDIPSTSSSIHQPSENCHWHCFRPSNEKGVHHSPKRKHKSTSKEYSASKLTERSCLLTSSNNGHSENCHLLQSSNHRTSIHPPSIRRSSILRSSISRSIHRKSIQEFSDEELSSQSSIRDFSEDELSTQTNTSDLSDDELLSQLSMRQLSISSRQSSWNSQSSEYDRSSTSSINIRIKRPRRAKLFRRPPTAIHKTPLEHFSAMKKLFQENSKIFGQVEGSEEEISYLKTNNLKHYFPKSGGFNDCDFSSEDEIITESELEACKKEGWLIPIGENVPPESKEDCSKEGDKQEFEYGKVIRESVPQEYFKSCFKIIHGELTQTKLIEQLLAFSENDS